MTVPAHDSRSFRVAVTIDAARLPVWTLNGGSQGGNGPLLQDLEFDGYIGIADDFDNIHIAWHVLPHKAAAVVPAPGPVSLVNGTGSLELANSGAVGGRVDVFSLTGTSKKIPRAELPEPGDNFAVVDLKAVGVRGVIAGGQPAVQFGITTNGARSHPNYPAEFDVFIDSDRDGTEDYAIFNLENGGFGVSGQNVVAVVNLRTNAAHRAVLRGCRRRFRESHRDGAPLGSRAHAGVAVRFLRGRFRQLLHGHRHRCHRGDDVYARAAALRCVGSARRRRARWRHEHVD